MQVGCQNAVQAAAVFETSFELIMFIQNTSCTIAKRVARPILIVLVLFPLSL